MEPIKAQISMINSLTSNSASKNNSQIKEKEKAQGKLRDLTEDEGDYVTKQWQNHSQYILSMIFQIFIEIKFN